jgi:four helix bundle protein
MDKEELLERLLNFAARTGMVCDALPDTRLGRHIAGQLVRSGTSPAPNYSEGCADESRDDFVHKLSICLKELRESNVWLRLILKAKLLSDQRLGDLLKESTELCNIFGKSIATAKSQKPRPSRSQKI